MIKCPTCDSTQVSIKALAVAELGRPEEEMQFQKDEPVCKCIKCGYSWLRDSKTPVH